MPHTPSFPALRDPVAAVWRAPDQLHILERSSRTAALVTDVAPPAEIVLTLLDGTREMADIEAAAVQRGVRARDVPAIISAIEHMGLLGGSGSDRRWRRDATVAVHGLGAVGVAAACLLAASEVGRIVLVGHGRVTTSDCLPGGFLASDVGHSRLARARVAVERASEGTRVVSSSGRPGVSITLFAHPDGPPRDALRHARHAGTPFLTCEAHRTGGTVGPFVTGGSAPGSVCPECLDHHRRDLDPQWPLLDARMPTRFEGPQPTVGVMLASLAAGQILAHLDGHVPSTHGAVLEVRNESGEPRRQVWSRHPACACNESPAEAV